jgi:hypothetical protein
MEEVAAWLGRMRAHVSPGPATSVATSVAGQVREFIALPIGEDLDAFAMRLIQLCRDYAGDAPKRSYVFKARDDSGKKVGVMRYTMRQPVPETRLTTLVEETVSQASSVSRQFRELGVEAVLNTCKTQERILARLQAENLKLRRELDELRARRR